MSDTPRIDAEANGGNSMGVLMGNGLRYALVQSEFARQLERELNAANERIKRLEEESESRWNLAQSAIGSCAEMSSRIKQLEEALGLVLRMRNDWLEMQDDGYAGAYYAFVKGNDSEWEEIIKAKEAKP